MSAPAYRRDFVPADDPEGAPCHYCGVTLTRRPIGGVPRSGFAFPVREHMTPLHRGGADDETNVVWACFRCNNRKALRTAEEFTAQGLMTTLEWRHTVPCPTCGTAAGARCLGKRGKPYFWSVHKDRRP